MRHILAILALLFVASLAFAGTCTTSDVNDASCAVNYNGPATTQTITLNYTANQLLVVGEALFNNSGSVSAPTASGFTFSSCSPAISPASYIGTLQLYCGSSSSSNASQVITLNYSSTNVQKVGVIVQTTGSSIDKNASHQVTSSTTSGATQTSTSTATTTQASEQLVGVCANNQSFNSGGSTWTAGSGWTAQNSSYNSSNGYGMIFSETESVSSTGAYAATASVNATLTDGYNCAIVTVSSGSAPTAPSISPGAGTFNAPPAVTLSSTGATSYDWCEDTANTCTPSTAASSFTPTVLAATTYIRATATNSYGTSSVASAAYVFQVATPTVTYGPAGATTFATSTSGASLYYNNTGSTATCSSTLYSGAVYASGTNAISVIGCLSGYSNSSVLSVQPDIPVASDNFANYYNSNYGNKNTAYGLVYGPPYQLPIDCAWTGTGPGTTCNWTLIPNGVTGAAVYPIKFANQGAWVSGQNYNPFDLVSYSGVSYYANGQTSGSVAPSSSPNWNPVIDSTDIFLSTWSASASTNPLLLTRTGEGYNQNHGSLVYLHNSSTLTGANVYGPATLCSSSYCMVLLVGGGTAALNRYASGTKTNIAFTASGVTYSDGAYAELRAESGCTFRLLLNGQPIPGMAATYTDSGCATTGQPGVAVFTNGDDSIAVPNILYNVSTYNVGGTSGAYTPPTVPALQTYTDSMSASTWTPQPPLSSPWFKTQIAGQWSGVFAAESWSGGYGAGIVSLGTQYEYRGVFSVNQWQAVTITVNAFDSRFDNYFLPLDHQPFVQGLLGAPPNCASQGTTATCYDPVAYYSAGMEPINQSSKTLCAAKPEYCGTPWVHITKVTPTSSTGDQVITVSGSGTTLMAGDQVMPRYNAGWLDVYCKQNATPLPTWSIGMTITAGTTYIEGGGMVWLASTSGTAGLTQPTWPTSATWSISTYTGTTVSDGTGVWMYWGDTCPTDTVWTRIVHVYDGDLKNPASTTNLTSPLGTGFPAIWGQGTAVPFFTGWSAGSVGVTGDPCLTPGACVYPATYVPQSFIP